MMRLSAFGMEKTVYILLADDDYQVLSALRLVLEQEPAWLVVNEFHNAADMVYYFENACQRARDASNGIDTSLPSILLIDWELPGFQPKKHIREIRSLCPGIKIMGLSVRLATHRDALTSQVDVFVSKSEAPERVIVALQDLMHLN
jgi:DNA-binding NarL/FixJ family response regulator